MRTFARTLAAVSVLVLSSTSNAVACPMCKMALETDDPQPKAYMFSILFMLGMIGAMFGGMAGLVWWLSRQERLALESAGYQHIFENGVSEAVASR